MFLFCPKFEFKTYPDLLKPEGWRCILHEKREKWEVNKTLKRLYFFFVAFFFFPLAALGTILTSEL